MSADLGSDSGRKVTFSATSAEALVTVWMTAGLITLGILALLLLVVAGLAVVLRGRIARRRRAAADHLRQARANRTSAPVGAWSSDAQAAVTGWTEADLQ
ncbi:hypothetical protein ET495_08960 [Xylanimonas allomyrinae]|uniref:Uncharacterized protein n=1 Tax=Xylanimonas allomyrinae TaxID=2509459 RepID=A0A4P6ELV3_9MICO|nr:hypothetical protein [Xylanimonas allomyrinae]QAY63355.1 hypothetical protein ET495_08960 [Xylanimonas allomyrinae]